MGIELPHLPIRIRREQRLVWATNLEAVELVSVATGPTIKLVKEILFGRIMRYLFMHNYRGFRNTLIPLCQVNFLVGENSTGKSSVLSLVRLINQPAFWFGTGFSLQEDLSASSFADILSAWTPEESSFQIGVLLTKRRSGGGVRASFTIHEYTEVDDNPRLSRFSRSTDEVHTTIVFEKKRTRYSVRPAVNEFDSDAAAQSYFLKNTTLSRAEMSDAKSFPRDVPTNLPLPLATSLLQSLETGKKLTGELKIDLPMNMPVTWIAPIRSKPKRTYDGVNTGYSAEGDHVPFVLRKALRSRSQSKFLSKLSDFGQTSGLFETIIAHSYGRGSKDPFELVVQFKGADLNISNVGYGVSQALPLIVEFLNAEKDTGFAVQQPEVHLHPRAQASLGNVIFEMANERKHTFFLETHSDYLIDRYRISMRKAPSPPSSQLLFFQRTPNGNEIHPLPISDEGMYPRKQPKQFRDFFIKEEMALLEF